MEQILEFLKGPGFRFSIAIMVLGLIRVFILAVINGLDAKKNAGDKQIPVQYVKKMTIGFLLPLRAFRVKPMYSLVSIIFHIAMLLTPLFLIDHLILLDNEIGVSWIGLSLSKPVADYLTLTAIAFGVIIFIMRVANEVSRFISRKQDYLWPLLLIIPFATGYVCSNFSVSPDGYNFFMIMHIFSACVIFILIPFTKISHCVLLPLSQWISARSWKFPSEAGEKVAVSLGKEGELL